MPVNTEQCHYSGEWLIDGEADSTCAIRFVSCDSLEVNVLWVIIILITVVVVAK